MEAVIAPAAAPIHRTLGGSGMEAPSWRYGCFVTTGNHSRLLRAFCITGVGALLAVTTAACAQQPYLVPNALKMARDTPLLDASPGKAFDITVGAAAMRRGRAAYGVSDRAEVLLAAAGAPARITQRIPLETPIRGIQALAYAPDADRFFAVVTERRGGRQGVLTFKIRPAGSDLYGADPRTEVRLDCLDKLPAELAGCAIAGIAVSDDGTRIHLASPRAPGAAIATFEVDRSEFRTRTRTETIWSKLLGVRPLPLPAGTTLASFATGTDGFWLAATDPAGSHAVLWAANGCETPAPAFPAFGNGTRIAGMSAEQGTMLIVLHDPRGQRPRVVEIPLIVRK